MDRIKSYIKSAFSYPRKLWAARPVTAVCIIAATLIAAVWCFLDICIDLPDSRDLFLDFLLHVGIAAVYASVFALCLESMRMKWGMAVKAGVYIFFGVLSLFMSFINSDSIDEYPYPVIRTGFTALRDRVGSFTVWSCIFGLLAVAVLLAVWFSHKYDIRQNFNEHVLNAASGVFFATIVFGVIQIGVVFLVAIVNVLLYDDAFKYLSVLLVLINGLFYAPALLCALTQENEHANVFFRSLVRYVMLTLSLLAHVIIYIYIIKLAVTRSVPSNSVFAILTVLFAVSMFISYMCTAFENRGALQRFAYLCPLIFAPFIIMQCYTVFVRINQYGLTPKRYFGVALILFEIIYIFGYLIRYIWKKQIIGRETALIACFFLVIAIFVPGISAGQLSTLLAKRSLSGYLDRLKAGDDISDRECMWANAAAGFLHDPAYGQGRLEKYFPQFDEDARSSLREKALTAAKAVRESGADGHGDDSDSDYPKTGWYSAELMELAPGEGFDISGYEKLLYVSITDQDRDTPTNERKAIDPAELRMYFYDKNHQVSMNSDMYEMVDLSEYVRKYIAVSIDEDMYYDYEKAAEDYRKISVIDLNEKERLYITRAEIEYDVAGNPLNVEMDGYLFMK